MTNPNNLKFKKIFAVLLCFLFSFILINCVTAQSNTVVKAEASTLSPQVGSTLIVTIKISNVQNLAGIDTTLLWDASVLTLQSTTLNLGDSHSNSVLHGTSINIDPNSLNSGDIYVQETKVAGSYELVAQAVGASNPAFSGSGTIVTLTFSVEKAGLAGLSLQTDLADHPATSQTAQNIDHQDTADTVTAIESGTTSTPTTPEYPVAATITIIIAMASIAIVLSIRKSQNGHTSISQSLCT
jgi:hypothetical protein